MRIHPIAIALLLTGCAILSKPSALDLQPTTTNDFLENPFGHDESVASFMANLPKGTHAQKLIHRNNPTQRADTIYNFKYKKSKIAVFKSLYNQEFVMGGNVTSPHIQLSNGVRVGMSRDEFHRAFIDLPASQMDTIRIKHPTKGRAFGFFFSKKGILYRYTFSGTENRKGAGIIDE